MEAVAPLRSSILPCASAGVVFILPADERRRIFRTEAGRADVHGLLVARKRAVRNNHRFGFKSDHRDEAVSILDEGEKALGTQILVLFGARPESEEEGISASFNTISDTAWIYGGIHLGSRGNDGASDTERSFVNYGRSPSRSRADEIISMRWGRSLRCVGERSLLVLYGQTAWRPVTVISLPCCSRT